MLVRQQNVCELLQNLWTNAKPDEISYSCTDAPDAGADARGELQHRQLLGRC